MGRRYYCDYCDKTFIDDVEARKKHLNGGLHQKLRNEHYQSYRDLKTLLCEEIVKQPCRRFMVTGICQFLSSCRYTHYTQEDLWQIKTEVDVMEMENQQKLQKATEVPTLDSWLQKHKSLKRLNLKGKASASTARNIWWHYPEILEMRFDLPPSLIKFKPEHFKDDLYETWAS